MIEFEVSVADAIAFAEFHASRSPRLVHQTRLFRYDVPFLIVGSGVLFSLVGQSATILLAASVGAVGWFLLVPAWLSRLRQRSVLSLYSEGLNRGLFGRQRLVVSAQGLHQESGGSKSLIAWTDIERVEETPSHIFIYLSAVSAIPIPPKAVSHEQLGNFKQELAAARHAAA